MEALVHLSQNDPSLWLHLIIKIISKRHLSLHSFLSAPASLTSDELYNGTIDYHSLPSVSIRILPPSYLFSNSHLTDILPPHNWEGDI